MKIRIYETDFEGHPLDCSGEYFSGKTALDIVERISMNPFQSHLTPHDFMAEMLAAIGQKDFELPCDPEKAALAFLQKLTALGYAEFAIDEGELEMQHGYGESPVIIKK